MLRGWAIITHQTNEPLNSTRYNIVVNKRVGSVMVPIIVMCWYSIIHYHQNEICALWVGNVVQSLSFVDVCVFLFFFSYAAKIQYQQWSYWYYIMYSIRIAFELTHNHLLHKSNCHICLSFFLFIGSTLSINILKLVKRIIGYISPSSISHLCYYCC